jgi:hypothetical protein
MYGPPPVCKRDLEFGALTVCSNVFGLLCWAFALALMEICAFGSS